MLLHLLLTHNPFKSHVNPFCSGKQKSGEDNLSQWWKEAPRRGEKGKGESKLGLASEKVENSRMMPQLL